jgi:hypothetical protein
MAPAKANTKDTKKPGEFSGLLTWTYKYLICLKLISKTSISRNNDHSFTIRKYDLQKHNPDPDCDPERFGVDGPGG